jgi:signal transduction histidine kinase
VTGTSAETADGRGRLSRWMSDVRGFQYGFSALFFLDIGVRAAVGARWPWWSWPVGSLVVVLVLLVVTPFLRVERDSNVSVVLAVIDIGVVGISRLAAAGGSGLLLMLPTLWLGRVAGRRGAVVSVVATVFLVSLPSVLWAGWAPVELARAVLYPFVVGAATLAMAESMEWVREERAVAERQRDQLAEALQVKDEFVALVSHELRTPLTSIVGYAQLLEDDPGISARGREQLVIVQRNGQRLHRLIEDLLTTAQRDQGVPMTLAPTPTDLGVLVRQSVEATRPAADAAGVELVLEATDALRAEVDPQRISQVVDNLLSNAVKYSERGGRVDVRVAAVPDHVEITVADTGIGISATDQARLFTPFFRTDDAARRAAQGAGLGLSITRDIITGHGGTIGVESEPGRGSVFRVRLPA